jgi:hypothetical protein
LSYNEEEILYNVQNERRSDMGFILGLLMIGVGGVLTALTLYLFYTMPEAFQASLAAGVAFYLFSSLGASGFALIILIAAAGAGYVFALQQEQVKPYAKQVLGALIGTGLAMSLGNGLGMYGITLVVVGIVGAAAGYFLVQSFYEERLILALPILGASLVLNGLAVGFGIRLGIFNVLNSSILALVAWIALAAGGIYWQMNQGGAMIPADKRKMP